MATTSSSGKLPERVSAATEPLGTSGAKVTSLSWVRSIGDVVGSIPVTMRGVFRKIVEETYVHASGFVRAQNASTALKEMFDNGKTPVALNSLRAPTIQASSAFLASVADKSALQEINNIVASSQRKCHREMIKAKQDEATFFLTQYLSREAFGTTWTVGANDVITHLSQAFPGGTSAELASECRAFTSQSELYRTAIMELASTSFLHSLQSKDKRRKTKTKEDVEMADAATNINSRTIASMVDNVLSRRKQSIKDKKAHAGVFHLYVVPSAMVQGTDPPSVNNRKRERSTESCQTHQESAKCQKTQGKTRREARHLQEAQAVTTRGKETHFTASGSVRCLAPRRQSLEGRFPFSTSAAVFQRLIDTPVFLLERIRGFHPGVHKQMDVCLPKEIEYFLALNIKYCFPITLDLTVPVAAFEGLCHRLRIRWKYRSEKPKPLPGGLTLQASGFVAAHGPSFLEQGISIGRKSLLSQLGDVEPADFRVIPPRLLEGLSCSPQQVRRFLSLNQYMAFITDKNLGIAVVKRDWYETQVLTHLATSSTYVIVPDFPVQDIEDEKDSLLSSVSFITGTLAKFMAEETDMDAPVFHAIPKIHKTPWSIRPIVPMHSYVTNRLAQFVQVMLHPLEACFPWVCTSSKSFVWKLLRYGRRHDHAGRQLLSGDVRSMYTNVPRKELCDVIRKVLKRKSKYPDHLQDFLVRSVAFLNNTVFFRFKDQVYHQLEGIAMGLPCGPSLANLYLAYFEEEQNVGDIPFYQRYIDDCFAVDFSADNVLKVLAPGLVLDWVTSQELPFLDVFVHFHGQSLCVSPHTKRLNHYQFLPWSSAHPRHVKKGTIKAELLRAAHSSAKESYFLDRREAFRKILSIRGYPERVVSDWFTQVEWKFPGSGPPYKKEVAPLDALFVPTRYNPAWTSVTFQGIYDEMYAYWRKTVPVSETLPFPTKVMKSLSRTKSMWDFVRKVNKEVLSSDREASL